MIASVNKLENMKAFGPMLTKHDCKIIVVDEGDENFREKNDELLSDIEHVHYGPRERKEWFRQRLGANYRKYLSVIPERCHAETSFGFLIAYEEQPDLVVELDDDVFPIQGHNIVYHHADNLFHSEGATVYSKGKWYNSIENLELNTTMRLFPRGYPYLREARMEGYVWSEEENKSVLNMGLWAGHLDLDALTILYHGGLAGRCGVKGERHKISKVVVGKGTYLAVCSMNTSFLPNVIPAFYQLYMNFMGVDRFDDIWSGLFLKKIADHLGDSICLGEPLVYHDKRPRDTFKDLKKEFEGIMINEVLWKIVDTLELAGKTYWDSYNSLINGLEESVVKLQNRTHQRFILVQLERMRLWLELIDKL